VSGENSDMGKGERRQERKELLFIEMKKEVRKSSKL
jgi:hypothetical protein